MVKDPKIFRIDCFIKLPTQDIQVLERWIKIISTLNYCMALKGAGCPLLFSACNKCKYYDHPTSVCTFPYIPGWLGSWDDVRLQATTAVLQQPLTVGLSFLNAPLAVRNNHVSTQPAPVWKNECSRMGLGHWSSATEQWKRRREERG